MKGNKNTKRSVAQIAVDAILEQLDKGVSPWHKPWTNGMAPRAYDGRPYRGINRFLLGCAPFETPVYLTFKKAHELGGTIRKGERSLPVFLWHFPEVERVEDEETGEEVSVRRGHFFLRYYNVFNVDQTEGIPAAKIDKVKAETFAHNPIPEADALWTRYWSNNGPQMVETGSRAFYSPSRDVISIPDRKFFPRLEDFYAILFHEAGHSTGHASRLNRVNGMASEFGTVDYGREELVAELCAAILCGECGIERSPENPAAYCDNWAKAIREAPANAVVAAASAAEKAADYVLGRAEAKKEVA